MKETHLKVFLLLSNRGSREVLRIIYVTKHGVCLKKEAMEDKNVKKLLAEVSPFNAL